MGVKDGGIRRRTSGRVAWVALAACAGGLLGGALACSEDESSPSAAAVGGTGNEGGAGGFGPVGATGGTLPVDATVADVQSDAPPPSCGLRFADSPLAWPVPPEVAPVRSTGSSCDPARYLMGEFTGDGLTDLVALDDCDVTTSLGSGEWHVYPNEGSGFGAAVAWPIPPELEADGQTSISCTSTPAMGSRRGPCGPCPRT